MGSSTLGSIPRFRESECAQIKYRDAYAYLENVLEFLRLSVRFLEEFRQVDIEESRDMTQIKQADMAEVNRFLEQHGGWNHPPGNEVPCKPQVLPVLNRWYAKRRGSERGLRDRILRKD